MTFNHTNAGAHLYGSGMDIHSIVYQRKCRVSMAQAVERSVEPRAWAIDQLALFHKRAEVMVYVLAHCSIGQSKY